MDKSERERERREEAKKKGKGCGSKEFRKVPKTIFSKFQLEIFLERKIRVKLYMPSINQLPDVVLTCSLFLFDAKFLITSTGAERNHSESGKIQTSS
jgi:hypothetical protein